MFWLKLGFISFGGPTGQIAIMHEFVVEKKKWISEGRFMHALNYCMLLPGPEAQQLATYIGWLLHGVRGGLTAGILFILPSVFILLILSVLYMQFGTLPIVASVFYGIKPAIVAIVVVALFKIGKKALHGVVHIFVALASFVAIYFMGVPFPVIILIALAIGVVIALFQPAWIKGQEKKDKPGLTDNQYVINEVTTSAHDTSGRSIIVKSCVGLLLWALPVAILYLYADDFLFWFRLITFFTKSALITFGGAYAVLPYVAEVSVEQFHWLSAEQMVDGLALGESTPGPLIMVLAFVGFMAGFGRAQSVVGGTAGLVLTTYYTFLPCFLFILIGAPLVEKTKDHNGVRNVLAVITAAVVGVILNLALYFGKAVLYTGSSIDYYAFAFAIVSFVVLQFFKMNMIAWILISAVVGMAYYFVLL
jgi:chromate transporter